jgi:hypothetical protein
MRNSTQLREEGFREFPFWMEQVETLWAEKRANKADKHTAYEWLDYSRELTAQRLTARYLVLYNAAGTNLSATRVDRSKLTLPFVVEHKLYWCACANRDEADYLAAILNADLVNEMIKPFQSQGLLVNATLKRRCWICRFLSSILMTAFISRLPDSG